MRRRLTLKFRVFIALSLTLTPILLLACWAALNAAGREGNTAQARDSAREVALFGNVLAEPAILRDYTAIERFLKMRVNEEDVSASSYRNDNIVLTASDVARQARRPDWFAGLVGLQPTTSRHTIEIGGVAYGTIELETDPGPREDQLWTIFSVVASIIAAGMLLALWLVERLLEANLRGLTAIREASRRYGNNAHLIDDADAEVEMPPNAPPELLETAEVLNYTRREIKALVARLAADKERWRVTLDSVGDGVIVVDRGNRILFMNPVAERLTGWSEDEAHTLLIETVFPIFDEDTMQPSENPARQCLNDGRTHQMSARNLLRRRDGSELPVLDSAAPIFDAAAALTGCVMVFRDDSERRAMMHELRRQALQDPLTGLPNRRAMEEQMEQALRQVAEAKRRHAFCYIDLDQFKLVNDTCGHAAGDTLLKDLTQILQRTIPPGQCLGRLGGDEFGLLLFDTDTETALATAENLISAVNSYRFRHGERSFSLGASVGVTTIGPEATAGELLSQADTACYAAKSQGRNRVQIYEPGHAGLLGLEAEMEWVGIFEASFAQNRFRLYRQRIVPVQMEASTDEHYEILLRHLRANGQIDSPGHFLPAAERYGLAPSFDRWVLRSLLDYLVAHPEDTASYAINLSGATFADPAFQGFVKEHILASDVAPDRLTFEITETAVVRDLGAGRQFIRAISDLGCQFSLDDFGSGLSSFAYLKSLPVDTIKIDGGFVRELDSNPMDFVIVNAIAQIGRDLKRKTVAEFVEDDAILAKLREIGVDYAQGYAIHMPEPLPAKNA